jgi:thiol:disulfide interchange protein/DsbC/DsbD-like thiol-disulfide interchange protein
MHPPFVFLLPLLAFSSFAQAQFDGQAGGTTSAASLVSEASKIAPGKNFTVALQLVHPADWHSYYLNSGGVELPPSIEWKMPEGFSAGPIQFPVPEVKDGYFGKSFVFSGSPVFLMELTAPASLKPGETVTLTADAEWQICKESCINEERSFTLTLDVAPVSERNPATADLFVKARASQPIQDASLKITAQSDGGDVQLRVNSAVEPTDFIPNQPFLQSVSSGGSIGREGDLWLIKLKRATIDAFDNPIPQGTSISGILVGPKSYHIPDTAIASPPAKPLSFAKYLPVLGGMLLGGMILNLMPCVFPVIGLKIMGFVQQAGSDRKKIALHGVIFTLGVLASFAVLSGILFAARETIGWGYQLQSPWVVAVLMLLMFVLALNMYGVFEMGTSATSVGGSLVAKQGMAGSFFSGVLATVLATPCSGPFLGVAIGAAFGLPAFQFFLAFAAMAIGLALPYLILSVFPKLIDFLPRPGAWMESFKQAMSFLLFATAGYLLWVYAGLIDLDNLLGPIFGLSTIAIAGWIHGRWNLPHRTRKTRTVALVLTLFFAAVGFILVKPPQPSALTWEPWSQQRVEELLADGTPVYIDFTAQWCATCQVNKKRAYTKEVIALMKEKGVIALKADKTKPNPEIEAALQKLGRNAIPVNVLLAPGKDPFILPELLAPDDVSEALKGL